MARLIDADTVKQDIYKYIKEEGRLINPYRMLDYIDSVETSKAIPIEWMKKFANERALNDGMDGYWHFWGTDLLQMIEQWERENETN